MEYGHSANRDCILGDGSMREGMWSVKLGLHLLSLRFLLGDVLWFGLAHLIEFRLYVVSLRLSGVGVLLCRLQNH
jgi:hypothetical protein